MPITLGSNISSLRTQRSLADSTQRLGTVYERLSSGMRINHASDDAAGLAISNALKADSRIYSQATRNINDALSVTSIADSVTQELKRITERQLELAHLAANGVYTSEQRELINAEAKRLTEAYNSTVLTTTFNGRNLFTESWNDLSVQAGIGADAVLNLSLGADLATVYEPGDYFRISSGSNQYNVWFSINGAGSAPPFTAGVSNLNVNLTTQNAYETVDFQFYDPADIYDGYALYIGVPGDAYNYLWFDKNGDSNGDPVYGEPSHRVDISSATTAADVATAARTVLEGLGYYTVSSVNPETVRITSLTVGSMYDSYDNDGAAQVNTITQGMTDLASQANVAAAIATALNNTGRFTVTINSDNNLVITSNTAGRAVAEDVNSGVGIETIHEGQGLATYTGGGIQASAATGDFNEDGLIDIVTGSGGAYLRLNQGDGNFGPATAITMATSGYSVSVISTDLNGDDHLDLVTANWLGQSIGIRYGNGNGTFQALSTFTVNSWTTGVTAADIDNDGDIDIGIANGGASTMQVVENLGGGTLALKNTYAGVANNGYFNFSDINRDGYVDMLGIGTHPYIRLNNGNGTFGAGVTYTTPAGTANVKAGDLNGDGWQDLVIGTNAGNLEVRLNDGAGNLGAATAYAVGGTPAGIALADFNDDGALDIGAANYATGAFSLRYNNGDGTFGSATTYSGVTNPSVAEAADLDGDGHQDMMTVSYTGTGIGVRFNDGAGAFEADQQQSILMVLGDPRGRVTVNNIDLTTVSDAKASMNTLTERLGRISAESSSIGAAQSRLEAALSLTRTMSTNYEEAAARIMDADIAYESSKMIREQILQRVGSSILAQANQIPDLALRLLKNL